MKMKREKRRRRQKKKLKEEDRDEVEGGIVRGGLRMSRKKREKEKD